MIISNSRGEAFSLRLRRAILALLTDDRTARESRTKEQADIPVGQRVHVCLAACEPTTITCLGTAKRTERASRENLR